MNINTRANSFGLQDGQHHERMTAEDVLPTEGQRARRNDNADRPYFAYAENNPLNMMDPTGLSAVSTNNIGTPGANKAPPFVTTLENSVPELLVDSGPPVAPISDSVRATLKHQYHELIRKPLYERVFDNLDVDGNGFLWDGEEIELHPDGLLRDVRTYFSWNRSTDPKRAILPVGLHGPMRVYDGKLFAEAMIGRAPEDRHPVAFRLFTEQAAFAAVPLSVEMPHAAQGNLLDDLVAPAVSSVSRANSSRLQLLQQGAQRNTVLLDENLVYMKPYLEKHGYTVLNVATGTKDPQIVRSLEHTGVVLVTRNYDDFKGVSGVIRASDRQGNLKEEVRLVMNSLEVARINPEVWVRMKQIPASGLNTGHKIVPEQTNVPSIKRDK
jgi:hypothetical protein